MRLTLWNQFEVDVIEEDQARVETNLADEPASEDLRLIPEPCDEKAEANVLEQVPVDLVEMESMESFPCSDPPSHR